MLVSMSLFMLMLVSMSIQMTIHTYNMGKHKTKTCNVCFKSMRGDKLKKHMKKHDGKTEDNVATKGVHDGKTEDNIATKGVHDGKTEDNIVTKGPQIRYTEEELEKRVSAEMEEFNRNIELGGEVNKIVNKN